MTSDATSPRFQSMWLLPSARVCEIGVSWAQVKGPLHIFAIAAVEKLNTIFFFWNMGKDKVIMMRWRMNKGKERESGEQVPRKKRTIFWPKGSKSRARVTVERAEES